MTSYEPAPPEARKLATTVWWLVLVQGIVAIVFGVLMLAFTHAAVTTVMILFGIFSLIDGGLALYGGFRNRDEGWGWLIFQGFVGVAIGILALRYPSTTAVALTLLVAFWALVSGLIRIWGSIELKRLNAQGWVWALVAGIAAVLFGLALVIWPNYAIGTLVWLIGITVIIFGIALVINAFLVRRVVADFADDGVINNSNA